VFLYINVLNYRYFRIDYNVFKIKTLDFKKRWKNKKKTLKTRFYEIKNKKNVYKRLLQLCFREVKVKVQSRTVYFVLFLFSIMLNVSTILVIKDE